MSPRNLTSLGSDLASVTNLKRIQTQWPHRLYCDFRGNKTFGQAVEIKIEPKFEPLLVIWKSLQRLFQKVIEGLEGKINSQALGAALLLCLRGSDGRAQTQGVSKSAARCWQRLACLRKTCYHSCDTDSVQESTRFSCFVNFGPRRVNFFSHVKRKFRWNLQAVVADKSRAHRFAQSFNQSLVSE